MCSGRNGTLFSGRIAASKQQWVVEHRVFGRVVVPGTALLEMAQAVAQSVARATEVGELTLEAPLLIASGTRCAASGRG